MKGRILLIMSNLLHLLQGQERTTCVDGRKCLTVHSFKTECIYPQPSAKCQPPCLINENCEYVRKHSMQCPKYICTDVPPTPPPPPTPAPPTSTTLVGTIALIVLAGVGGVILTGTFIWSITQTTRFVRRRLWNRGIINTDEEMLWDYYDDNDEIGPQPIIRPPRPRRRRFTSPQHASSHSLTNPNCRMDDQDQPIKQEEMVDIVFHAREDPLDEMAHEATQTEEEESLEEVALLA